MDSHIKTALEILGFKECAKENIMPKLKVVTKKYYKLAMVYHPDKQKPGDDGEVFKKMTAAYRLIGEYLEQQERDDNDDGSYDFEEEVARRTFKQFEFSKIKENMRSFTIHIDNDLSLIWDKILSKHYGEPLDKKVNGLHWKVANYSDGILKGNVVIGKWHIPKNDGQSKLNVQSNEEGNFLPAHFVDNVLPKLLEEVHLYQGLGLKGPLKEMAPKKEILSKQPMFKCDHCAFVGKNLAGLSTHVRMSHKKEHKTSGIKPKSNSISVEEFGVKFSLEENVVKSNHVVELPNPPKESSSLEEEMTRPQGNLSSPKEDESSSQKILSTDENKENCTTLEKSSPLESVEKKKQKTNEEGNTFTEKSPGKQVSSNSELDGKNQLKPKDKKEKKDKSFPCKHCAKKFKNVIQLTTHMKTCHTKVDQPESGNAITINSPFIQTKHFFCHCSLCGEGYDDYIQLSSHENEKHSFNCEVCKETFMVKSDLDVHVSSMHEVIPTIQCEECGSTVKNTKDLEDHKEAYHTISGIHISPHSRMSEMSTQTLEEHPSIIECGQCQLFKTLQKEHIEMKTQYERLNILYAAQSNEKQAMHLTLEDLAIKIKNSENETAKSMKDFDKRVKEMDLKFTEVKSKLSESYEIIKRKVEENVRLAEENKTLSKILEVLELQKEQENEVEVEPEVDEEAEMAKVMTMMYVENGDDPFDDSVIDFYLNWYSNQSEQDNNTETANEVTEGEQEAEVIVLDEGDDPDDDDIIEFYLQQGLNRSERTSPMSEALTHKPHSCHLCQFKAKGKAQLEQHVMSKHNEKCDKCSFATETKVQLNLHKEAQHSKPTNVKTKLQPSETTKTNFECTKCDFVAKSSLQLNKHLQICYGPRKRSSTEICWNWQNGFCERNPCAYAHPVINKRYENQESCRYQQFCRKPDCPFFHNNQQNWPMPCPFGTGCQNSSCRLEHRNCFLG